jgi:hypothetical protein
LNGISQTSAYPLHPLCATFKFVYKLDAIVFNYETFFYRITPIDTHNRDRNRERGKVCNRKTSFQSRTQRKSFVVHHASVWRERETIEKNEKIE